MAAKKKAAAKKAASKTAGVSKAQSKAQSTRAKQQQQSKPLSQADRDFLEEIEHLDDSELAAAIAEAEAGIQPKQQTLVLMWVQGKTYPQIRDEIDPDKSDNSASASYSRTLASQKVRRYKWLVQAKVRRDATCNATNIQDLLWTVARRCVQQVEPVFVGTGENREFTGEFKFDAQGAVAACRELNAMQGNHKPTKVEAKGELSTILSRIDGTSAGVPEQ